MDSQKTLTRIEGLAHKVDDRHHFHQAEASSIAACAGHHNMTAALLLIGTGGELPEVKTIEEVKAMLLEIHNDIEACDDGYGGTYWCIQRDAAKEVAAKHGIHL